MMAVHRASNVQDDSKEGRGTGTQKLRYFRLSPNLALRKLINLANYVPSSRDSRNDF